MRKTWVKRDNIYYKPFYKQKLKMMLLLLLLMAFVFFGYQFFYISQLQTTESGIGSGAIGQQHHLTNNNNQLLHEQAKQSQNSGISNDVQNSPSPGNNNREPPPRPGGNAVQDEGGGGGAAGGEDNGNRTSTDFRGPSEDARYVYIEKVGNYEKRILRGIRLRDLDAYSHHLGATTFRCLSSTRQVAWARVNDDYCDCPEDGSDEPSTGACDRGRFYCRFQKRHATGRGGYTSVPSGWINDGVCDCCDGSDEWLSGAAESCRNTCKERFPY